MKKIIFACLTLLLFIGNISGQTKMNVTKNYGPEVSYVSYTGDASDTIKRVADSVYTEYILGLDAEYKINVVTSLAKVSGNDTTVKCTIWGRNSVLEAYTVLNISTSANVTSAATILSSAYTTEARYRYIKISYKLAATPKSLGVKVNSIELKVYKSSGK
jgi:hypothetical protein